MVENWKKIAGYEGLYFVSNFGRIKRDGKILKELMDTNKYLSVALSKNGAVKRFRIHRLVGKHFLQTDKNKNQINHKDGIKSNNFVSNLEWVTCSENHFHAFRVLGKNPPLSMKGKFGKDHNRSKTFILISPNGTKKRYGSMLEAEREIGADHTCISFFLKKVPHTFKRGNLKGYTLLNV